jgi:hypothetical protein
VGSVSSAGPVSEFCAKLDALRIGAGADVPVLARRLSLSRAQLYAILGGRIRRPPDWDRVVRPLVDACTGGDAGALAAWRQRHAVLTGVWEELRRRNGPALPAARVGRGEPRAAGAGRQRLAAAARQPVPAASAALAVPAPGAPEGGAGPPVIPRELPAAQAHFTGRARELAALTGLLDRPGQEVPGAVVISAIGSTAGAGKTALAVHWAHRVAGRFPDGQLYVNLRGYDPDQPVPAADALGGMLRSLGVPGPDIPPGADDRAARYRSVLAGRRMLVVLDNAGSAEQVRPLLPGSPSCAVLVTSRDALAGLVARDGAARLDLDVLPLDEAVALLRALIGERVDHEPEAAAELASQCCRLPLALRVAAELAASRAGRSLASLTAELADLDARLDLLEAGSDPLTSVRTVLSWSCRQLDADTARAFRLLGLHPGLDLEPYAAAALAGLTVRRGSSGRRPAAARGWFARRRASRGHAGRGDFPSVRPGTGQIPADRAEEVLHA